MNDDSTEPSRGENTILFTQLSSHSLRLHPRSVSEQRNIAAYSI